MQVFHFWQLKFNMNRFAVIAGVNAWDSKVPWIPPLRKQSLKYMYLMNYWKVAIEKFFCKIS